MCAITTILTPPSAPEALEQAVRRMTAALTHRGPDDEGLWVDAREGVALGHRRLSILDVSPEGHQPMVSAGERYVMAFNGEIYNFQELRKELEQLGAAPAWRGGSDTEVLLAAVEHWGLLGALERAVGMFALSLWDRRERQLLLARDRLGKKPLYYGLVGPGAGASFVVSSELHAVRAAGGSQLELDPEALGLLSRFGFIPDPWSIYRGVKKLLPGHVLTIPFDSASFDSADRKGFRSGHLPEPVPFWSLEQAIIDGQGDRGKELSPQSEREHLETLRSCLQDSVRMRLRSDVPLGAFLSGGIDSSLVVALMQEQSTQKVRTFSIGFEQASYDESADARRVAEHLGTEHTEFKVRPEDALSIVDEMADIYDEPFADSSQLPTTLVARLARKHVTVVLTGDGGDELFAGYNRHIWGRRVWQKMRRLPPGLRKSMAAPLRAVPPTVWTGMVDSVSGPVPPHLRVPNAGDRIHKLARLAGCQSPEQLHLALATHWDPSEGVLMNGAAAQTRAERPPAVLGSLDPVERALWFDTIQGLPGDMLVKVDRATMSVGLEARQPLLDHRLCELSWRMPLALKVQGGVGKWALREILAGYVPRPIWDRPKMGFAVPIGEWLRGPLRPWAEELLSKRALQEAGVFSADVVRRSWHAHLAGRVNADQKLWIVLMTQSWLRHARLMHRHH